MCWNIGSWSIHYCPVHIITANTLHTPRMIADRTTPLRITTTMLYKNDSEWRDTNKGGAARSPEQGDE